MHAAFVGTVSGAVLRSAGCPVLVVPPAVTQAPERALRGEWVVCAVRDDRDAPAVELAATLAELLGLGLMLAQVLPPGLAGTAVPGPVVLHPQGPAMTPERLALRQLEQLVDGALADHPALRDGCELRLRRGHPAPQLDALCEEEQAALIVLGPQRRGALRVALLGSVARDLARHGTAPDRRLPDRRAPGRTPRHRFSGRAERRDIAMLSEHDTSPARSVVCGVDGSAAGRSATRFAAELARRLELRLLAVHVASRSGRRRGPAEFLAEAGARGVINQALSAARARGAEARIEHGPAAMRLALVAAEEAAAVMVLGTRAEPGPESTPLGAVAAAAVTLSPCPVVLVPPSSAGQLGDGELLVARAEDQRTLAAAGALARALGTELRIAGSPVGVGSRAALIVLGPDRPGPRRGDALDPLARSVLREATVPVMLLPAHLALSGQHAMAAVER